MLEKSTIARPYAQAVFELSQQTGDAEQWSSSLELLNRIVSDEQMYALLSNPKVTEQQLLDIISEIASSQISGQTMNFVKVLVAAGRLQYIPQIVELFESMRASAQGKVDVEVISAYELDESQKNQIAQSISQRLGKEVNITATVDESLIGGAVIRAGDSVIDASLSGRLQELGNALA